MNDNMDKMINLLNTMKELEKDYTELFKQNKKLSAEVEMLTDEIIYRERVLNAIIRKIKSL